MTSRQHILLGSVIGLLLVVGIVLKERRKAASAQPKPQVSLAVEEPVWNEKVPVPDRPFEFQGNALGVTTADEFEEKYKDADLFWKEPGALEEATGSESAYFESTPDKPLTFLNVDVDEIRYGFVDGTLGSIRVDLQSQAKARTLAKALSTEYGTPDVRELKSGMTRYEWRNSRWHLFVDSRILQVTDLAIDAKQYPGRKKLP